MLKPALRSLDPATEAAITAVRTAAVALDKTIEKYLDGSLAKATMAMPQYAHMPRYAHMAYYIPTSEFTVQ